MHWNVENQLHAYPKLQVMTEYWIVVHKIPTDIEFNVVVMIAGKEGHTHFQTFTPSEEGCNNPKVVWDNFA